MAAVAVIVAVAAASDAAEDESGETSPALAELEVDDED